MEKKHQYAMLASIVHIVNGDWPSLVHALTEMDIIRAGTNIQRVTLVLDRLSGFFIYMLHFFSVTKHFILSRRV